MKDRWERPKTGLLDKKLQDSKKKLYRSKKIRGPLRGLLNFFRGK